MKLTIRTLIVSVVMVLAGGLIWGFLARRSEQSEDAKTEAPVEAPSRVFSENGKTVLSFDAEAQHANGIVVATLVEESRKIEEQANGVVLDLQPILDRETAYSNVRMDLVKARASARVSLAEYERLQQLNRDGKNASDKAVEAARAASESDTAVAQNVAEALAILKSSIALRWGPALASWLEQGSPRLNALLAQRMFLLQVTSMNGGLQAAPRQAIVRFADGTHTSAQLISLLPQLDQRLQTPSFLYLAPAHSGLIAGMNLPVFLTAGAARGGVLVPISAAVWWQGKAWCYVELSPGKFTREQVSTVNPLDSGWFVTEGIAPRTRVVISGAQTLLSEEFRSQIQTDED